MLGLQTLMWLLMRRRIQETFVDPVHAALCLWEPQADVGSVPSSFCSWRTPEHASTSSEVMKPNGMVGPSN